MAIRPFGDAGMACALHIRDLAYEGAWT